MAEQIERAFGVSIPDDQMFLCPTIAGQAALIRRQAYRPVTAERNAVVVRRVRTARDGEARGVVLAMPGFSGKVTTIGQFAAGALGQHEIWACTRELCTGTMDRHALWRDTAEQIVALIRSGAMPRPTLLFGFSFAGWFAWLVDRLLVAEGFAPTPIVNIDGGTQEQLLGWKPELATVLDAAAASPARMLLVHCGLAGRFRFGPDVAADWRRLGVGVTSRPVATVSHEDTHGPGTIAIFDQMLAGFIHARDASAFSAITPETPGAEMHRMLAADRPPASDAFSRLLARLPARPIELSLRAPLLFLALCAGNPDTALAVVRRITDETPDFAPAAYVGRVLSAQLGDGAAQASRPKRRWGDVPDLWIGTEAALDFAIALCMDASRSIPA